MVNSHSTSRHQVYHDEEATSAHFHVPNYWVFTVGRVAPPLLPIYASQLGANPSWVGNYFSLAFAAVLGGSVVAGWASDRFQHRKELFVAAGVISAAAIWLMGQVTSSWYLVLLTVVVWFMAGVSVTLLLILTELFTEQAERGRAFSLLAMSMGLGRLLGGGVSGRADCGLMGVRSDVSCPRLYRPPLPGNGSLVEG